jgi:hypothetical protein
MKKLKESGTFQRRVIVIRIPQNRNEVDSMTMNVRIGGLSA